MVNSIKIKNMVFTSIFAAVIYITVTFLFHIPTGINSGYIHLGDAFIYLSAAMLPKPYAIIAAGIGAGLADVLSGSVIWLLPTVLIKPTMTLYFSEKKRKILCKQNVIAIFFGGVTGVVGYYAAEIILYGSIIAPLAGVIPNIIQAVGSGIIFLMIGFAFDKINFKKYFM